MCEQTATSIVPGFLRGRLVRQPQPQPCACQPPAASLGERFDKATGTASKALGGIGVIVMLAAMDLIIHILVIAVGITAILALTGVVIWQAARLRARRRRPALPVPAPDPELAAVPRTTVTAATVLRVGSASARGALQAGSGPARARR